MYLGLGEIGPDTLTLSLLSLTWLTLIMVSLGVNLEDQIADSHTPSLTQAPSSKYDFPAH